jgi:hypothetical protein
MWRSSVVLLASAFAAFSLGCQKDEAVGGSETETGPLATETASDESTTETETDTGTDEGANFVPGETETETGEPPEPLTCREMLDCVFMCLTEGQLGLDCLQPCGEGFDPAEAQKAGELVLCIGQTCVEKEQCMEFTSPDCIGCIGLGLFLPEPPGCEAEAAACQ